MMKKMMERIHLIRKNQKENGKKGFSMIELIIVIAIMAILIALIGTQLLPYLNKSRKTRDLDTLSAALTAVQSTMTEFEISSGSIANVTSGNAETALNKYLGYKWNSCKDKFTSDEAGTGGTLSFSEETSNGNKVIRVTYGNLWVQSDGTNSEKPTTNNTTTNNTNGG